MDAGPWSEVLDRYERRLDDVERALAAGDPATVPAFEIPDGLPTIPAGVADRARALLARCEDLQRTVSRARTAVGRRLRSTATPVPAPTRHRRLDVSL